jgi:hypothetical protein
MSRPVLVTGLDNPMTYGLLMVGLVLGFGFLMVIGLLSVLRDLFARGPLLPGPILYDYQENRDSSENDVAMQSSASISGDAVK